MPFDLLESQMMILKKDRTTLQTAFRLIKRHGYLSLYDGYSAQMLRQLTYTTVRFHLYDIGKQYVDEFNFLHKIFVATVSGMLAGIIGIPSEMINTRMQVDREMGPQHRRNYKHVFDGFRRVVREEGFRALYTGGLFACSRAALITIGQNAMYDQSKILFLRYLKVEENSKWLHTISSLAAGLICVPLVQPLEILKTMQMVSTSTFLSTRSEKTTYMMRFGLRGLFRGFTATVCRMVPSTIIMFVAYEQLRLQFGYYKETDLQKSNK
ncbi:mitochondrial dicarboxylate carrier-like [Drosophila innubila]|uniref:mitochondrial dicarboxylate carrier-like n=1 Tax=Drosophila innubila TaxID=198719 RepID=UPI00148B4191|nr:mitochondrial dicarboxylate carrier-like [Drosophila innubila]